MIGTRVSRALKSIATASGFEVQRRANTMFEARKRLIRQFGIEVVLDVGANSGQYGVELRRGRYKGKIVSFEPLTRPYATLAARCDRDSLWQSKNIALGALDGDAEIFEAENSVSSSLLRVTATSTRANAATRQTKGIKVSVRRLDSVFDDEVANASKVMLKVDTQGYELEVLTGAGQSLERIDVVECELSFREVYEGQPLFFEVSRYLYERGFVAVWIERGFQGPSRELLQVDALFARDRTSAGRGAAMGRPQ